LRDLGIAGHSNGIDCLRVIPGLEELSLNGIKKNVKLDFVSKMKALKSLSFLLGGRSDISEIKHESLKRLEIIRVLGFETISLGDFPVLEELQIEDKIRLKTIDFPESSRKLRQILLLNCKALDSVTGFLNLQGLEHLRIFRTALDFDRLIENDIPSKLRIFAFYDPSKAKTKTIRARLDKLGYTDGL
jgi:protein phosphatase 1 regulatory subunit 7